MDVNSLSSTHCAWHSENAERAVQSAGIAREPEIHSPTEYGPGSGNRPLDTGVFGKSHDPRGDTANSPAGNTRDKAGSPIGGTRDKNGNTVLESRGKNGERIRDTWDKAGNHIRDTQDKAGKHIRETWDKAGNHIRDTQDKFGNHIHETWDKAGNHIRDTQDKAGNHIREIWDKAGNHIRETQDKAGNHIRDIWNKQGHHQRFIDYDDGIPRHKHPWDGLPPAGPGGPGMSGPTGGEANGTPGDADGGSGPDGGGGGGADASGDSGGAPGGADGGGGGGAPDEAGGGGADGGGAPGGAGGGAPNGAGGGGAAGGGAPGGAGGGGGGGGAGPVGESGGGDPGQFPGEFGAPNGAGSTGRGGALDTFPAEKSPHASARDPLMRGFNAEQQHMLRDAYHHAKQMVDAALDHLLAHGPDSNFQRWFGAPTPANVQHVTQVLSNIQHALAHDVNMLVATRGANSHELAHVFPDSPHKIDLAPLAFTNVEGRNTLETTLIHELSHFTNIGGTEDHSYGRADDHRLAATNTRAAITNADNYGMFIQAYGSA
ncbi:M35 family metallo-endopeptidase [Paraburkholderia dinghuensis]|uniref:Lysine-specific metallo-endopeptidase domain-containing protein n=1 Tax=Paraburkholderia dinghuensis TaxID=2305225 RepID=A0A3N6NHG2_9BURK|nr:M35 family metallo-endopeptidase [Paraburkholderia dinghuensis]RQH08492.1 hypothetical protein D1Y85_05680 [Paraburkholderia dinghuensis]